MVVANKKITKLAMINATAPTIENNLTDPVDIAIPGPHTKLQVLPDVVCGIWIVLTVLIPHYIMITLKKEWSWSIGKAVYAKPKFKVK